MSVGGWIVSIALTVSSLVLMGLAHAGTFGGFFVPFIIWGPVLLGAGIGVGMINAGVQNPLIVFAVVIIIIAFFTLVEDFNFPPGLWKYV